MAVIQIPEKRLAEIKDPREAVWEHVVMARLHCRVTLILDNAYRVAGRVVETWEYIPWTKNHPQGPTVKDGEWTPIRGCVNRASIELDVVDHDPIRSISECLTDPSNPKRDALLYALEKVQQEIEEVTLIAYPDDNDPNYYQVLESEWQSYFEDAGYTIIEAL